MERCVSFTGGARPDRNWSESRRIAAAEHLTCLSGPFGDASCLLEEVGDCGLPDFQVVGSVRLRGAHENMKSIGPAMKTRALGVISAWEEAAQRASPPHPGRNVQTWHGWWI